jgi:hypothetical protein
VFDFTEGKWSVTVKTSEEKDSGTSAQVYLTGFGTKGQSQKQPLGLGQQDQSEFSPGAVSEFNVSTVKLEYFYHLFIFYIEYILNVYELYQRLSL